MPALSTPPAIIITFDEGGEVSKYIQRERAWEAQKRRIIVRGLCGSACTIYLKSPFLCAEPTAQFAFHESYLRRGKSETALVDPESNSYMLQWYPQRIREFIASQGGLTTTPVYLEGRWMQQLVPQCK
ncbi:hypothetical protein [Methylocapsa acidiphila]|uniref:hypothetical protein n=1 Tax=Methylocapsa acidiphila TaxID=133552 RepID=UPI0012EC5C93|nr:hypothetical protein [Methylocapsa acidiphila]